MQPPPGDRFDGALQIGEGELARHQLEHHGAIFQLGAQSRDRGRKDAAVIESHGLAQRRHARAPERGAAAVTSRLLDQARLVEELVAVEHLLLVPRAATGAEAQAHALASAKRAPSLGLVDALGPLREQRQHDLVEDLRPLFAPILPREEAIPGLESGAGGAQPRHVLGHAGEGEIADRDDVRAGIVGARVPPAIAEGVELLHVAHREPRLRLDPRPQPHLERAVRQRIERPGG